MTADVVLPAQVQRPTAATVSQMTAVEQARAVAEVQAAVVVAQQCPRDMERALGEMRHSCGRLAVAERAFYSVPNRGSGKSVHLARELARIWGNVSYGVHELRRDDEAGESEIQAFAWDLEANVRNDRTFIVPHARMKRSGGKQTREPLVDLADIYLNNNNIGARAVRECIFATLPAWLVDEAEDICRATLQNGEGKPLETRVQDMVRAFQQELGVSQVQLENRIGRKRGQWSPADVAQMTIVYKSIRAGEVLVGEEFPVQPVTADDLAGGAQ